MNHKLTQEIKTQKSRILQWDKYGIQLNTIEREIEKAAEEEARLREILEKERRDYEKLEEWNLTSLFYKILGSKEQQREKERQEYLAALLEHDKQKALLDTLGKEKAGIKGKIGEMTNPHPKWELLIFEKERFIKEEAGSVAKRLFLLDEQIQTKEFYIKEADEALAVGRKLKGEIEKLINVLGTAMSWGTWDILGGGMISTHIKHSHIDDAKMIAKKINYLTKKFSNELTDIQGHRNLKVGIDGFSKFGDYFFDGLITDWIVQNQLDFSLSAAKKARRNIHSQISSIKDQMRLENTSLIQLRQERLALIENA